MNRLLYRGVPVAVALILSLTLVAISAFAQIKLPGSLSSIAGPALGNIGSIGMSNAAGVLKYCMKDKVLSGANAESVLGQLTGQKGVTTSPGFSDGEKGLLKMKGSSLSLKNIEGKMKSKACKAVLKQAQSFL